MNFAETWRLFIWFAAISVTKRVAVLNHSGEAAYPRNVSWRLGLLFRTRGLDAAGWEHNSSYVPSRCSCLASARRSSLRNNSVVIGRFASQKTNAEKNALAVGEQSKSVKNRASFSEAHGTK